MQLEFITNDSPMLLPSETYEEPGKEASQKGITSPQEDSRARIFPSLVKGLGWQDRGRACGTNMLASFANYDQNSQSWKTSGPSLSGEWIQFSGRFPKSGMMRNGRTYGPATWERPTAGSASGLLPTPIAGDSSGKGRMWSTPTANDAKNSITESQRGRGTLTANMVEIGEGVNGGKLNPPWVEWLMGYPIEWTASNVSGMRLSLISQQRFSDSQPSMNGGNR